MGLLRVSTLNEWIKTKSDEAAWDLGMRPDLAAAERVRTFFHKFLRHSKGQDFAGKPFDLLDWQWERWIKPLFAWKRPDGTRRFRRGYLEVPKKNGKSTLLAGQGLYLLIADREPGAEVYIAAAEREQASIIFREMLAMVRASPELAAYISEVASKKRLEFPRTNSFIQALSAEANTKEGLNIHGLLFDELHAQTSRKLWDALEYGGASRRQPLLTSITTAGHDRDSICYEQHLYAEQVNKGVVIDPEFLGVIFAADPTDDWRDESTWAKANPSYGVTIKKEEIAAACKRAQNSPASENAFKRYRLNIWTEQETRWIPVEKWDACDKPLDLDGPCYGGLDLSATCDLTAFVLYFPHSQSALPYFWVPEETCKARERTNKTKLDTWVRKGFIRTTPGNVLDYDRIRNDIAKICLEHNVKEIAIDKWNSTQISNQLKGDGRKLVSFTQGYFSFTAPTKELEKLVIGGTIRHGGNPVLRWNFSNLAVDMDAAGNVKPNKAKSSEKIDGIVGLIMAIGLAIAKRSSVYEKRGMYD